ncbi:hypothetical protein L198_07110 [Cryptococcus wingfieldii CBS 7118]|uniref:Major facilitator superfamily (MFS) profile domain-containing protein n=1 Tax=Cryptococcus wingfieldii CBS 7118 TaxID=1295528 RepID=A0A1E3IF18_9TREE|nr:hypothetical protein L198_07110 [Cryptococcus wingfieldii CBS 7118]ODN87108.1 hypothetical protein L198_07110 [Cryptococcus wingfieldii CBS 7118]
MTVSSSGVSVNCAKLIIGLGFSSNFHTVFGVRFLLGFTESAVSPCMLALMVQWCQIEEQPFVTSIWQAMLGTATGISALFACFISTDSTISRMERSMADSDFTSQSLSSALSAPVSPLSPTRRALADSNLPVIVFLFLPSSPTKARWATEEEKVLFVECVRANNQGLKQKHWNTAQAREAFTDPFTLCLFALCVFNTLVVGGISTYSGLLITKAFGFSNLDAQLLSIPIGAMGVITFLTMGFCIRKTNQTCYTMIAFTIPNIVGTVVLLTVAPTSKTKGGLVVSFPCYPATLMLLARNSAGQKQRRVSPNTPLHSLVGLEEKQSRRKSSNRNGVLVTSTHSTFTSHFMAVSSSFIMLLARRNKKNLQGIEGRKAAEGEYLPGECPGFRGLDR